MEARAVRRPPPPLPSCFSGHVFLAFAFVNASWLEGIENGTEVGEAFLYEVG